MSTPFRRHWFATEVVQTSSMDCGPAALKSLLEGFGLSVSYGRLREACQTDVDGTSIDSLESVASDAGLDAEQIMVPIDHVLLSSAYALPAIAVVRSGVGGTHFAVVWRAHSRLVQMMDPARGRLWTSPRRFIEQLIQHTHVVEKAAWHTWARSNEFLRPLAERMHDTGVSRANAEEIIRRAQESSDWLSLATLDAAVRLTSSLRLAGSLSKSAAMATIATLLDATGDERLMAIPDRYWSVRPGPAPHTLRFRGAVLLRAKGLAAVKEQSTEARSPEIAAALGESPARPLRELWAFLATDGTILQTVAVVATILSVVGVVAESVVLRSLVDVGSILHGPEQRWWSAAAITAFAATLLTIDILLGTAERRLGQRLEARVRIAFLDKIPKLSAAYFQSRPMADMLERSHSLHTIRMVPRLVLRFFRVLLELAVTAAALIWLNPATALLALAAAVTAALIPIVGHAVAAERDLRVRTHAGALARYHLDALRGRTALEAHGASAAIEREHEGLLAEWAIASFSLQKASLAVEAIQLVSGVGLVTWFLLGQFGNFDGPSMLLQTYWLLNLPTLGYELALVAREYPSHRSTIIRMLEPLKALEIVGPSDVGTKPLESLEKDPDGSPHIEFRDVAVRASGQSILEEINLRIAPGAHVAIIGASGAGKSSLIGLLLGWHRPAEGEVLVDGAPLDAARLQRLRTRIAWVDPTIQIWNAPMLDNLIYGTGTDAGPVGATLEATSLSAVVAGLPDGLATRVGESGTLLSGGEAQRVRLARALLKQSPHLVLLDEPFFGLERERRKSLLAHARQRWAGVTLFYVTHDVAETRAFDRVVVVERGRIVEEGDPRNLSATASRYRRLVQTQETTAARLATSGEWQRLRMESGHLVGDRSRSAEQRA